MSNVFFDLMDHLANSSKPVFYDRGNKITGNQFRNLIISFAARMKNSGVTKDSCVALDATSVIVATALNVACGMIGCSWVKYSVDSIKTSDELGITHIFHESPVKETKNISTFELDQSWGVIPEKFDPTFTSYDDENKIFLIAHSSGTTGDVKFIKISFGEYTKRVNNNFDIQFEDAKYGAFLFQPLKSTTQYKVVNLILKDVPVLINFNYVDLLKYENLQLVCSHVQAEWFIGDNEPPEVPFDAILDVAGSSTDVKYLEKMFQYFKQINIGYGATETSRTFNKRLRSIEDFNGSSGYKFPDVEIRIDESGSVLIKTPRAFNEENEWFEPGDFGYMKDGELFITGRKNDQLNFGGVKVNPVSIEEEIKTIDGVTGCLVFKDDRIEQAEYQISALVVCDKDVSREIHTKCNDKFGISKVPQNIYYVDELPRNDNGKASRKLAIDAIRDVNKVKYVYIYN